MALSFKRFLLTQPFGTATLRVRERWQLLRSASRGEEALMTMSNNELAMRLLIGICQPGKTFIDVGSHIGSVVAAVKRNVPQAKLIAVEAMPDKAAALRQHFPFAQVLNCAAADEEGEAEFFVNTQASGFSSLLRPSGQHGTAIQQIRVAMKKLDGVVTANDVDVVKIDVEGAELRALRGAEALIARCRPLFMFESGWIGSEAPWPSVNGLYEFFESRDYALFFPNRLAHTAPGLSLDGFRDSHWYPQVTNNYFAAPRERHVEYRDRARRILGVGQG